MMVLTNIIGGLGNQMFQYACGRALSQRYQVPLKLAIDMFQDYRSERGFDLNRVFAMTPSIASDDDLSEVLGWRRDSRLRKVIGRLRWSVLTPPWFIAERSLLRHQELALDAGRSVYLHGYWQSSHYFEHYTSTIRSDFTFSEPLTARNFALVEDITEAISVSVHVRRSDYITSRTNRSIYCPCSREYYIRARDIILAKHPTAQFFAFSDDSEWVREVLCPEFRNLRVIDHNRGPESYIDMRLMSMCKHHIIANSSFSWWGAWLNPRTDKTVIAPRNWIRTNEDCRDLTPSAWTRI
jgi:hypothetical protein